MLTPMQKLHALRTHLLPKLYHLVQNTSPLQSELQKINAYLQKTTKQICFLPNKASNNYIHLNRMYGGPGITDVICLRRLQILTNILETINDNNLKATLHNILSTDADGEWLKTINEQKRAGLHPLLKECASALKAFSKTNNCCYSLQQSDDGKIALMKNGKKIPFPITHLKSTVSSIHLKALRSCKNQGRFWETLQQTPAAARNTYNFHTKMCDWRFVHQARLNLTPLNGAIVWGAGPKECRRCQLAPETINQVLNSCTTQRKNVIKRHNAVRDHVEKWLPKDVTYYKFIVR